MKKQYSIIFETPINKAFDSVAKEQNMNRWMEGDVKTQFVTQPHWENPVGDKFIQNIHGFFDLEGEVIAYKNPFLLEVALKAGPIKSKITYQFEELEKNKTNLKCDVELMEETKAWRLASRTFLPLIHKFMMKHLEDLKKLAEEK